MKLDVADMNGDGRSDIIVACKTDLYIFYNQGYSPKKRDASPLPDRTSYPSHIPWGSPSGVAAKPMSRQGKTASDVRVLYI
jgi:hypothetical protein